MNDSDATFLQVLLHHFRICSEPMKTASPISAQRLNWVMIYYVFVVHVGFLFSLKAALFDAKWSTLLFSLLLAYLSGLGITGGAHRLWAHRSFRAHDSVRFFLMLCNSLANQGTILQWCRDHRVHHKFVDTPADPHDSTRGFCYSHMGWMFYRKDPRVVEAGKKINFDDLLADWTVRLQYQLSPWGNLIACFVVAPAMTVYVTGENAWTALLVAGFFRFTVVLHGTLLVNSAAHAYGYQPRALQSSRVENWLLAMFAIGEQFHLWHHKYPYDYASCEFGLPGLLNPTKLVIDLFALLGLVSHRKRVVPLQDRIKIHHKTSEEH